MLVYTIGLLYRIGKEIMQPPTYQVEMTNRKFLNLTLASIIPVRDIIETFSRY